MHKITALLLALVMLFSAVSFIGCAEKESGYKITTPIAEEIASETDITDVPDNLPAMDFEGYKFRMLIETKEINTYNPTEMDGEIVNDATCKRNADIAERFNMEFVTLDAAGDLGVLNSLAKKIILAGTDDFDLAFEHVIYGPNSTLEGLYMDLYSLEYLDFSQPWWPKETTDELTLNGKMFLGSGGIAPTPLLGSKVIVANRDALQDRNTDVPYQSVLDGSWTMDMLISMTKDVYEDLNGNGEQDFDDFYGYATQPHQNGFIVGCDISVLKKTEDGGLEIDAYGDKMVSLVEMLYDWYFESDSVYITSTDSTKPEYFVNSFDRGHALFAFSKIENIVDTYRYGEVNYGILPLPKYDEAQDTYRTFAHETFFCVPVTTTDTDRTSVIIEAMSAEGYKKITPAFYEIVLKEKLSNDPETVQMLVIINDNRAISFAYIYDNWEGFGHLFSAIFSWTGNNKRDYTSYYESRLSSATKRLDKIVAGFSG
ncbi:MAG: hypothetical protein PHZ09_11790 [Eubacteriales bacterium]|nr:hypothetical protein [Eubacteriales bacterium]